MREVLQEIRDKRLGVVEAAQKLREALTRPGQIEVLAVFVRSALAGAPIDPEALPAGEDTF